MIFCEDCKHARPWADGVGGGCGVECKKNQTFQATAITYYWIMEDCKTKNKDNNCKDYEQKKKWWKIFINKEMAT